MNPTKIMMAELSLVMSASHNIWGTGESGPPPPPPSVPDMWVHLLKGSGDEATFTDWVDPPTNSQEDIDQCLIYPGLPTTLFETDGPTPLGEFNTSIEQIIWNTTLLIWQFQHSAS